MCLEKLISSGCHAVRPVSVRVLNDVMRKWGNGASKGVQTFTNNDRWLMFASPTHVPQTYSWITSAGGTLFYFKFVELPYHFCLVSIRICKEDNFKAVPSISGRFLFPTKSSLSTTLFMCPEEMFDVLEHRCSLPKTLVTTFLCVPVQNSEISSTLKDRYL